MYAIMHDEFGPPDVLRHREIADPEPGPGQVRIEVEAAGVHLIDTVIRAGQGGSGPYPPPELPAVPGREVAGIVDQIGEGTSASWLGARVVAHLGLAGRGYAEYVVVAADALHRLPGQVTAESAVAMVGTGRTGVGIYSQADIGPDDAVLVLAAAGGVGQVLVQSARAAGATVVGVAGGPAKLEAVRAAGASAAIDYLDPAWPAAVLHALDGRDVDVVFEGVGGGAGRAAFDLMGPGGRMFMYGWASSGGRPTAVTSVELAARGASVTWAIGPGMLRRRTLRDLESQALTGAADGHLTIPVQPFALKDAADAHAALATRQTIGKVVLLT